MAEVVITGIPAASLMMVGYGKLKVMKKMQYKKYKKSVYAYIRKAIKALDFEDIIVGFEKLRDLDVKNQDEFGNQKRGVWERIRKKKRLAKCEKTLELFNIPKEMIDDDKKMKMHFQQQNRKEELKTNLAKIQEEEKKESETLVQLKRKLEKIKIKQLAENNTNRKIIDDMNLTKVIENLHKEYQDLFVKTFEAENDLTNIIQRTAKKQMIIKRMEMMNKKKKTGNLKSC